MPNSKCLVTFKNKMSHFNADLDFIDILSNLVSNGHFSNNEELFPGASNNKYTTLSKYKIADQNRNLVIYHLKSTLFTAYIKDLYEEFTIYLKGIMKEVYFNAKVNPERLSGEHKVSFSAVDVLRHLQTGDLAEMVIDNIFQSLENERSTIELINKFHNKIGIEKNETLIRNAIYFLEIRHKLVHTDGIADQEFKDTHTSLQYTESNKIKPSYQVICQAYSAVYNLVSDIDSKVIRAGLAKNNTVR